MNDELETRVMSTLRGRADDDVDTEALLAAATGRGRTLRRRRAWAAGVGTALAVITAGGTAVVLWPHLSAGTAGKDNAPVVSPLDGTGAPSVPPARTPPTPPAAPGGTPTALEQPSDVGNPRLFHLDLAKDTLTQPPVRTVWQSGGIGQERLQVRRTAESKPLYYAPDSPDDGNDSTREPDLEIILSRAEIQPSLVDETGKHTTDGRVNGKPAEATSIPQPSLNTVWSSVRWQPATGLFAEVVVVGDAAEGLRIASAVRLDTVYRCATPAKLGWAPHGLAQDNCMMAFAGTSNRPEEINISLKVADDSVYVSVVPGTIEGGPTTMVNGRGARYLESDEPEYKQMRMEIQYPDHVARLLVPPAYPDEGSAPTFDRATVTRMAQEYSEVESASPATWPTGPLD